MLVVKIFVSISFMLTLFGSSKLITVVCKYEDYYWPEISLVYQCKVQQDLNIMSKDEAVINNSSGTHQNGKTDKEVTTFHAEYKNIQHFPRNLEKVFVNLKGIHISNGRIKEIHQEDLKPFVKLEALNLYGNDIEILEDGLFSYNLQLKFINFQHNRIFHIDEHVFDSLDNLNKLRLNSNECVGTDAGFHQKVKELIAETKTKCHSGEFSVIDREINQLEHASTSASFKTCNNFGHELQELENLFQHSRISSHAVIKQRIQKVSNGGVQGQFCELSERISGLEKAFEKKVDSSVAELMNKIENLLDQSVESIDNKMQSAFNERLAELEKSTAELLSEMKKTVGNISSTLSALDVSIKMIIDKQNHVSEE